MSGHSSEPDLTIEKTIWKSGDDMMFIVEYEHYAIEAPKSNPKPIETNLEELSTKSESSILSVKNYVCLMFVFVVLYISLRFMKRAY